MARVAIYTRLSLDSTGEQTATARQEAACRSFVDARGWSVAEVFEDVDLSAYRASVRRPGFETLQHRAASGAIDGVVVWKLDRLVRRPSEFERFWAACQQHRVFVASVTEPVDSSTEIGVAIVRVLVTFASLESATSAVRISAAHRQRAERGLPHTTRPAFGHIAGFGHLEPNEAAAIREAAKRVLAGETTSSVCRDWDDRAIRTTSGKPWTPNKLMDLLCSPRVAGDREWRKTVVATDCFAPILDRQTHLRLRRLRASRAVGPRSNSGTTLLSGLLVCGECGGRLHSRRREGRVYVCQSKPAGCGRVAITAKYAEEHIRQLLAEHIQNVPPPAPALRPLRIGRYAELVERLELLHRDYYVHASVALETFLRCRDELDLELRAISTRSSLPAVEGLPAGFDLRYTHLGWDGLTPMQQRAVIEAEIGSVTVARARRGARFDPGRIEVAWRRSSRPSTGAS
jgi:site-specific DNA recombinase